MRINIMDRYSDEEFTRIIKESLSYRDCMKNLGYVSISGDLLRILKEKIQRLGIDVSHFQSVFSPRRTEEDIFVEDSTASQHTLRRWYRERNYAPYVCSVCGQKPMWMGKKLTLILDHINGHNNDNRLENLRWVCPNCDQQLNTSKGRNIPRIEYIINKCVDCGKNIGRQSIRCLECEKRRRKKSAQEDRQKTLPRDELKQLIRTTPFTKIAEMFGVSDNAVRKWCKTYDLPYRSYQIKEISDEDWEKI